MTENPKLEVAVTDDLTSMELFYLRRGREERGVNVDAVELSEADVADANLARAVPGGPKAKLITPAERARREAEARRAGPRAPDRRERSRVELVDRGAREALSLADSMAAQIADLEKADAWSIEAENRYDPRLPVNIARAQAKGMKPEDEVVELFKQDQANIIAEKLQHRARAEALEAEVGGESRRIGDGTTLDPTVRQHALTIGSTYEQAAALRRWQASGEPAEGQRALELSQEIGRTQRETREGWQQAAHSAKVITEALERDLANLSTNRVGSLPADPQGHARQVARVESDLQAARSRADRLEAALAREPARAVAEVLNGVMPDPAATD